MIACGDLNGRYSKLLVCDEVENLRLQMTPESDVFRTRGSFRMALGDGDSKVDLVMTGVIPEAVDVIQRIRCDRCC